MSCFDRMNYFFLFPMQMQKRSHLLLNLMEEMVMPCLPPSSLPYLPNSASSISTLMWGSRGSPRTNTPYTSPGGGAGAPPRLSRG